MLSIKVLTLRNKVYQSPFWTTQMCTVVTQILEAELVHVVFKNSGLPDVFSPYWKTIKREPKQRHGETVTFPKHSSSADNSPPWQQTSPEWQPPLQHTATGGVAESHQKPRDGYRAAFFTICQSDNIPGQYGTAVHLVMTSKRHSSNLRNASLFPQKMVGILAFSNKTHIFGLGQVKCQSWTGENVLNL